MAGLMHPHILELHGTYIHEGSTFILFGPFFEYNMSEF